MSKTPQKRKHDASAASTTLPRVAPALRVPVDRIMVEIKNDPTLQYALDEVAWKKLARLQADFESTSSTRKDFVDGCCQIIGTMKMLSLVQQLSQAQVQRPPLILQRSSSLSSSSSGTPGTPASAEVARINSVATRPSRRHSTRIAAEPPASASPGESTT